MQLSTAAEATFSPKRFFISLLWSELRNCPMISIYLPLEITDQDLLPKVVLPPKVFCQSSSFSHFHVKLASSQAAEIRNHFPRKLSCVDPVWETCSKDPQQKIEKEKKANPFVGLKPTSSSWWGMCSTALLQMNPFITMQACTVGMIQQCVIYINLNVFNLQLNSFFSGAW